MRPALDWTLAEMRGACRASAAASRGRRASTAPSLGVMIAQEGLHVAGGPSTLPARGLIAALTHSPTAAWRAFACSEAGLTLRPLSEPGHVHLRANALSQLHVLAGASPGQALWPLRLNGSTPPASAAVPDEPRSAPLHPSFRTCFRFCTRVGQSRRPLGSVRALRVFCTPPRRL